MGLFISYLSAKGYAANTVRTFISAVAFFHKINNFPDPSTSFIVGKLLLGMKKLKPSPDTRQALTIPMLHSLVASLAVIHKDEFLQTLFSAMFLFSFYALCRIGEVAGAPATHTLKFGDICLLDKPDRIVVTFVTFKHSISKQSVTIYNQGRKKLCPVQALKRYLHFRPAAATYLFVLPHLKPVSRGFFNHTLKACVRHSKLDPTLVKSHSYLWCHPKLYPISILYLLCDNVIYAV